MRSAAPVHSAAPVSGATVRRFYISNLEIDLSEARRDFNFQSHHFASPHFSHFTPLDEPQVETAGGARSGHYVRDLLERWHPAEAAAARGAVRRGRLYRSPSMLMPGAISTIQAAAGL